VSEDLLDSFPNSVQTQISAIRKGAAGGKISLTSIDTRLGPVLTELVHFQKIAGYTKHYTALLQAQEQAADDRPVSSFVLPAPQDDAARTALAMLVTEVERQTGERLIFTTTEPGHS
jgi:hypothetical protein